MAGGVQYHQCEFAYFQHFAISSDVGIEIGLGVRTINDLRAGGFGQVEVARYKVGMEMRFEYIFDFRTTFFGTLEVGTNFAERIYHHSLTRRFDEISAMGQTTRINLLNVHCNCVLYRQKYIIIHKCFVTSVTSLHIAKNCNCFCGPNQLLTFGSSHRADDTSIHRANLHQLASAYTAGHGPNYSPVKPFALPNSAARPECCFALLERDCNFGLVAIE